jgi:hypothetical protein
MRWSHGQSGVIFLTTIVVLVVTAETRRMAAAIAASRSRRWPFVPFFIALHLALAVGPAFALAILGGQNPLLALVLAVILWEQLDDYRRRHFAHHRFLNKPDYDFDARRSRELATRLGCGFVGLRTGLCSSH